MTGNFGSRAIEAHIHSGDAKENYITESILFLISSGHDQKYSIRGVIRIMIRKGVWRVVQVLRAIKQTSSGD